LVQKAKADAIREIEKQILIEGKYVRCAALLHDTRVKVIFRNFGGRERAYFMDEGTYQAIPLLKPASIEDYHILGSITECQNTDISSNL
jgi:hypothetical protein